MWLFHTVTGESAFFPDARSQVLGKQILVFVKRGPRLFVAESWDLALTKCVSDESDPFQRSLPQNESKIDLWGC